MGTKCLKKMDEVGNYLTAMTTCISMGATLATIHSQAEQNTVQNMVGGDGTWLGITDILEEGVFSWLDEAPVVFTNWRGGQPRYGVSNAHCVWMGGDGGWEDIACKEKMFYVCQKEQKGKGPRERTKI